LARERDFCKLPPAMQAELRRVAVEMVAAGKTRIEAAAAAGMSRRLVGEWVKAAARPPPERAAGADSGAEKPVAQLIAKACPDQLQPPSRFGRMKRSGR
jgi:hypothetical protein